MSNPRENREQEARAGSTSLAQATASGGMIAVVAVILLASWILKADPRRAPSSARANSARAASANPSTEGTPWNMAPLSPVGETDTDNRAVHPTPPDEPAPTEENPAPRATTQGPEAPVAPPPAPASAQPSSPLAERELTALQVRSARDAQRLAARRDAWVAQIAAVCNEDRVAEHVQKFGSSDRLYILPVTIKDRACYRMLWGTYDSAAAAGAADLPSALKSADKLRVLAVRELIP